MTTEFTIIIILLIKSIQYHYSHYLYFYLHFYLYKSIISNLYTEYFIQTQNETY